MNRVKMILVAAMIAAVSVVGATSQHVFAQADDYFQLEVVALYCDDQAPELLTEQQPGCRPANGVVFTASVMDTMETDSCTAVAADVANPIVAGCVLQVPFGSTVVVLQDPATLEDGYLPASNRQELEIPSTNGDGLFGGPLFVNMLQTDSGSDGADSGSDGSTPEKLPETGVGKSSTSEMQIAAISAVLGGVLLVAIGLRRLQA